MSATPEVIEKPLSSEELAVRYRAMCEDPCLASVPGKLEVDVWGRMVMTPPSTYHSMVQGRLCQRLAVLGGQIFGETPIATALGLFITDAAWADDEFVKAHGRESPFMSAPQICIEVVSPSNSVKELEEKRAGYFSAGAEEVWLLYLRSKRLEFHSRLGPLEHSRFAVDLGGIFDDA